jgi:threonine dehydratase
MTQMSQLPVEFAHIEAAAGRLRGIAVKTPLLAFPALDRKLGGRVFLKPETLQIAGSFKFRGAYNRLSQLDAAARRAGVVAWSSGNHAQGVAAAAAMLGMAATIVMPADAPAIKAARTREMGAEIIFYDRLTESREKIATALARARGAVLLPSYDDPDVIAGQGTVGLELAEQAAAAGVTFDSALVCCGGGGLIAGVAIALAHTMPSANVFAVEPTGFDDTARSLVSGKRETVDPEARSICDALLAPQPGELTFAINSRRLAGGFAVTDEEVRDAMRFAFTDLKLIVEPGGAVALAALLSGRIDAEGRCIAVVLSGGNVDPGLFASIIA